MSEYRQYECNCNYLYRLPCLYLKIKKAKGKFTLDEIIEAAKEWEEDYYAVIIKAMSDETAQYYDDDLEGDYVTLYRATDFISKEV